MQVEFKLFILLFTPFSFFTTFGMLKKKNQIYSLTLTHTLRLVSLTLKKKNRNLDTSQKMVF